MTKDEFNSYNRGTAYHVIKFERGEIDGETLITALKVQLGSEVFEQAKSIMDNKNN
jgi:hypothetical protein